MDLEDIKKQFESKNEVVYPESDYDKRQSAAPVLVVDHSACGWVSDGYRPPCYMNKKMKCEDCDHIRQTKNP